AVTPTRTPSRSARLAASARSPSPATTTPCRVVRYGLEKSTASARSGVIEVWYAARSNGFVDGATICSKVTCSHTTSSCAYPSCSATAYTGADSKPSPVVGSSPTYQGSYGTLVPIVSVPSVSVGSAPGSQAAASASLG